MNKHDVVDSLEVRPLGRVLARELTAEEVELVAGGNRATTGGNSPDGTTEGVGVQDADRLK